MSAFAAAIASIADEVIAATDELCRLDSAAGDGDLGLTMATAAQTVKDLVPALEGQDLATTLKRLGSEIARKAPSTSGTLLATACLRAGRVAAETSASGSVPDQATKEKIILCCGN
ncbi:MAG: DAK2 domain-containing protein, partial [Chloroflexota bacterium]